MKRADACKESWTSSKEVLDRARAELQHAKEAVAQIMAERSPR